MNFLINFMVRVVFRWMFIGMMPAGGGNAGAGNNGRNQKRRSDGVSDTLLSKRTIEDSLGPSASAVESQVSLSITLCCDNIVLLDVCLRGKRSAWSQRSRPFFGDAITDAPK